ncbi:phosphoadenosine phosphosulfate reductase family protein [Paenibacillus sp. ISL-20]|nr:phosphoadenosine phosphosulfate reductase family protein [Paenibacillus sp. ISL-20]
MKNKRSEYLIKGTKENPRHICGISGGKDSSALAIHIKNTRPDIFEKLELFFTDTGSELPEVYEYLDKMEEYLGKKVLRIKADINSKHKFIVVDGEDDFNPFDEILSKYNGYLPSPRVRWCTRIMKIETMEAWVGSDYCISYVGIRADEPMRDGYKSKGKNKNDNKNIVSVFPYREDNLSLSDIYRILENSEMGLPNYYKWRTRSGCYFCFYQRMVEWAILSKLYPDWFEAARKYEVQHSDRRDYTWVKNNSLEKIKLNADKTIIRYLKKQYKKVNECDLVHNLDQMIEMVQRNEIRKFIDSWDLKKLHDADGENKEGCTVCAI